MKSNTKNWTWLQAFNYMNVNGGEEESVRE